MIYLFLDLSTSSSGWCVANSVGEMLGYGCIQSAATNILKRVQVMQRSIQKLIQDYKVDKIIAEEVHLDDFKSTHTYKVLTWLQGIVILGAYEVNPKIQYDFIQASSWRSKIGIKTGRGIKREELKKKDIEYVKQKYNIDVNDDIADAISIKDAYLKGILIDKGFDWT